MQRKQKGRRRTRVRVGLSKWAQRLLPAILLASAACADEAPSAPLPAATVPASTFRSPHVTALVRAAAADSAQVVDAQIDFSTLRPIAAVRALVERNALQIVGITHGFRNGSAVQVGGYDVPLTGSVGDWFAGYELSTGEFLRTSVQLAKEAVQSAGSQQERQSYAALLRTFQRRLAQFEHGGPNIYSIRVRGAAGRVSPRAS